MEIKLTQGHHALVDKEEYKRLEKYNWCYDHGYARTTIQGKRVYMHRLILNPEGKEQVDHINQNKLDNRKENLRICTYVQNSWNKKPLKGYKNVCQHSSGRYRVRQAVGGNEKHICFVDDARAGAVIADYYTVKERDKYAHLNFPELREVFSKIAKVGDEDN